MSKVVCHDVHCKFLELFHWHKISKSYSKLTHTLSHSRKRNVNQNAVTELPLKIWKTWTTQAKKNRTPMISLLMMTGCRWLRKRRKRNVQCSRMPRCKKARTFSGLTLILRSSKSMMTRKSTKMSRRYLLFFFFVVICNIFFLIKYTLAWRIWGRWRRTRKTP